MKSGDYDTWRSPLPWSPVFCAALNRRFPSICAQIVWEGCLFALGQTAVIHGKVLQKSLLDYLPTMKLTLLEMFYCSRRKGATNGACGYAPVNDIFPTPSLPRRHTHFLPHLGRALYISYCIVSSFCSLSTGAKNSIANTFNSFGGGQEKMIFWKNVSYDANCTLRMESKKRVTDTRMKGEQNPYSK